MMFFEFIPSFRLFSYFMQSFILKCIRIHWNRFEALFHCFTPCPFNGSTLNPPLLVIIESSTSWIFLGCFFFPHKSSESCVLYFFPSHVLVKLLLLSLFFTSTIGLFKDPCFWYSVFAYVIQKLIKKYTCWLH